MVVSFDPIVISSRIWCGHLPHFFRAHVRHRQWRTGKDSDTSQQAEVERTSCQANGTAAVPSRPLAPPRTTGLCQRGSGRGRPACQYLTGAIENRDLPLGKKTRRHSSLPREAAITDSGPHHARPAKPAPALKPAPLCHWLRVSLPRSCRRRGCSSTSPPSREYSRSTSAFPEIGHRSAPAPFLPLPLPCAVSAFVRCTCPCSVRLCSPSSVCAFVLPLPL